MESPRSAKDSQELSKANKGGWEEERKKKHERILNKRLDFLFAKKSKQAKLPFTLSFSPVFFRFFPMPFLCVDASESAGRLRS